MTVKTDMSRFQHPRRVDGSRRQRPPAEEHLDGRRHRLQVHRRARRRSRRPARLHTDALRASRGRLPRQTRERIALAVAEYREDRYSIAQHARTARAAGLGLDEVSRARSFDSADEREAALLAFLKATLDGEGRPAHHLLEEAREIGWTDEQILEAVTHLALNEFQSLIANAAALPHDQTDPKILPEAA